MMVVFVAECEKKALNKTRRVLDAFANRIGNRTWQTVITQEGLKAVKKLLRKTATKNTAVSCHWIRSRSRSELIWVVGNKDKFNAQGFVPVNATQKDVLNFKWENDWHYLPLIKALVAISALFHDWGKASKWFQKKLKKTKFIGDPVRHEWISCLIVCALAQEYADKEDSWLKCLENGEIDEFSLQKALNRRMKEAEKGNTKKIFVNLPDFAGAIVWLILSHHRMPLIYDVDNWRGEAATSIQHILKRISPIWGYENKTEELNLSQCFEFPQGFPSRSSQWQKHIKRWAGKAKACLPLLQKAMSDGSIRIILHHARTCLMLGDHFYSSQQADIAWGSYDIDTNLFANTDRKTKELKQRLDEHLVKVAESALKTTHLLPAFEKEPTSAQDVKSLKAKSPPAFKWQDRAAEKIKSWRHQQPASYKDTQFGFFTVNLASTGCGKTIANAKVMRTLSSDGESLRYILALGLRTLTLQTGDEYRSRIGLDETELAVLIGSRAVMNLHNQNRNNEYQKTFDENENNGSESIESFIDEDIDYESNIPEDGLATVLKENRDRKFLYAPVLACTIDHIIGATETKRGGRYILPTVRLMSSDLVIDEVDDFDGKDLIAIGRLIHLAGMLGRKVMISSATIPPDLAEGYYNAYHEGWQIFSKSRNVSGGIGCAWIDEFNTRVETMQENTAEKSRIAYRMLHSRFTEKRVKKLKDQPIKRKAEIIDCKELYLKSPDNSDSLRFDYYAKIKTAIIEKHTQHNIKDVKTGKRISFGVVRMANIEPCIGLAEYLMQVEWSENIDPKIMAYHSRQVLLLRNEQENHLDEVLRRKEKEGEEATAFKNDVIRHHIDTSDAEHIVFILTATPVEEVGRDHDFDWAVIEPSSFRSLIQLAGRVMRHRVQTPESANMAIMQYNLRALKYGIDNAAYCYPGYEDNNKFCLKTHDLKKLVDESSISQCINSTPRIKRKEPLFEQDKLADLEHFVISCLLTSYDDKGPESMQGWLTQYWWLTALPQQLVRFRKSAPTIKLYLYYDNGELVFAEKNDRGVPIKQEQLYGIEHDTEEFKQTNRLWLKRDYVALLENIAEKEGNISMETASLKYGEITFPDNKKNYTYSDSFGLKRTIK